MVIGIFYLQKIYQNHEDNKHFLAIFGQPSQKIKIFNNKINWLIFISGGVLHCQYCHFIAWYFVPLIAKLLKIFTKINLGIYHRLIITISKQYVFMINQKILVAYLFGAYFYGIG